MEEDDAAQREMDIDDIEASISTIIREAGPNMELDDELLSYSLSPTGWIDVPEVVVAAPPPIDWLGGSQAVAAAPLPAESLVAPEVVAAAPLPAESLDGPAVVAAAPVQSGSAWPGSQPARR